MAKYTLTYSGSVEGWPSFYSYHPESMVGMNNYFYTFKNAQIYRHNSTTAYNTYYGVNYPSIMKTVINDSPLENKLFKTLSLESTHPWQAEALSDTPNQKIKNAETDFEKKENDWFSYLRNMGFSSDTAQPNSFDYKSRVNGGIGVMNSENSTDPANFIVKFPPGMQPINNVVGDGDWLLYAAPGASEATVGGRIKEVGISGDIPFIIIDTTIGGGLTPPSIGDFILYMKNSIAESYGILGHYMDMTLTLSTTYSTQPSELFAVETEVMKSFP